MAKVMLVEDDNNLREIYEARLLAEGYEIVSAQDGEEALALAVKEKPDLIIADIMMPKISGFDMLDILRSTPETKDVKVVMMTALSQAEDKARADKLGADRYLVKSQVTLEDVAKVAREVLEESGNQPAGGSPLPTPADDSTTPASTPPPEPPAPDEPSDGPGSSTTDDIPPDSPVTPLPAVTPPANNTAINNLSEDTKTENKDVEKQIKDFVNNAPLTTPQVNPTSTPSANPTQTADDNNNTVLTNAIAAMNTKGVTNKLPEDPRTSPDYDTASNAPPKSIPITSDREQEATTSVHTKVISPINDLNKPGVNLQELLAKEKAKEAGNTGTPPSVNPTSGADPNSISL